MPFMLIPIVKELFGISLTSFAVTDKSGKKKDHTVDKKAMAPFIILIALTVLAIIRILSMITGWETFGLFILTFWLLRNLYFLIMSFFLVDGRDREAEEVKVVDADPANIKKAEGAVFEGITTCMTEHSLSIYLDETADLYIGDRVDVTVDHSEFSADVHGVITGITELKNSTGIVYAVEILDFKGNENEYDQVLFDRIPSLPQSLNKDLGIFRHPIKIIAHRILS